MNDDDRFTECDDSGLDDADEFERNALASDDEAGEEVATTTSGITTARGAIEHIASMILDREIPGLDLGFDVDFEQWTAAGIHGHLRAMWKGLNGNPDHVDAQLLVSGSHHSEGHCTLDIRVILTGGMWIPDAAMVLVKLHSAVVELAVEIRSTWDGKVLALG